jgi:thiamine biosynthesis lipoprotein
MRTISRRRFLGISAAAAGLALAPAGRAAAEAGAVTWRGTALGAVARLELHHGDPAHARRSVERSVAELRRLERIFSLYDDGSAIRELNRRGVLVAPPRELADLIALSIGFAELTKGAFDPTVQPLWALYHDHFSRPGADPAGPSPAARRAALARVGYARVSVSRDRIAMPRGMALTLNGIAQGYITDRIVDLLRAEGFEHSFADLGEARVIGPRPDGRPWRIGIADPDGGEDIAASLAVVDKAVATSGGYGFRFDAAGRFNHLFDPASGRCADRYASVTVVDETAAAADALSTALSLVSREEIARVGAARPGMLAYVLTPAGLEALPPPA